MKKNKSNLNKNGKKELSIIIPAYNAETIIGFVSFIMVNDFAEFGFTRAILTEICLVILITFRKCFIVAESKTLRGHLIVKIDRGFQEDREYKDTRGF